MNVDVSLLACNSLAIVDDWLVFETTQHEKRSSRGWIKFTDHWSTSCIFRRQPDHINSPATNVTRRMLRRTTLKHSWLDTNETRHWTLLFIAICSWSYAFVSTTRYHSPCHCTVTYKSIHPKHKTPQRFTFAFVIVLMKEREVRELYWRSFHSFASKNCTKFSLVSQTKTVGSTQRGWSSHAPLEFRPVLHNKCGVIIHDEKMTSLSS